MAITVLDITSSEVENLVDGVFVVDMPATVNAGEALVMIESCTGDATGGTITPSGWVEEFTDDDGENCRFHIFSKEAVGNEGGTTVTITYNDTVIFATAHVYRISGWDDSGTLADVIEADAFFSGAGLVDPPSITPTWGSATNLYIAFATEDPNSLTTSTIPSGYGNPLQSHNGLRCRLLSCDKTATGTSENAGQFADAGAGRSFAGIIAIKEGTPATSRFVKVSWVALEATSGATPSSNTQWPDVSVDNFKVNKK